MFISHLKDEKIAGDKLYNYPNDPHRPVKYRAVACDKMKFERLYAILTF